MVNEHIKPNYGIVVKVIDKEVIYNVTDRISMVKFIEWITGKHRDENPNIKRYLNLILCTRTDEEINHPDYCPHESVLSELRFKFKSKLWEFIQDPWPDPLKDFNIDDQTFVLRFTYDEGCEMDRTWREWDTEDGYYILTNEEIVKL